MRLLQRHTVAVYAAPAGTIPTVPEGEDAHRVEINVDGIQFVWKRRDNGTYQRWAGPIGWLTADDFINELIGGDVQEAQAHG